MLLGALFLYLNDPGAMLANLVVLLSWYLFVSLWCFGCSLSWQEARSLGVEVPVQLYLFLFRSLLQEPSRGL